MKLVTKYASLIFYSMVFVAVFAIPSTTFALVVDFEETPLFSNMDIVPGDSTTRAVLVSNDTTDTQSVYVSVENAFNTGLADVMLLTITDGTTIFYNNTFVEFFNDAPVSLSSLLAGVDTTYSFVTSLPDGIDNSYQLSTFGFDLIVGFEGGSAESTGGGQGGGGSTFRITDEKIDSISLASGAATITWNTNRKGSSYLVCGSTDDGPFEIDTSDSKLGYPLAVAEVQSDANMHSMTILGLSDGSYECRPASRRSANSRLIVGDPLAFQLLAGVVAGVNITTEIPQPINTPLITAGLVLGIEAGTGLEIPDQQTPSAETDVTEVTEEYETPVATTISPPPSEKSEDCLYLWLIVLAVMTLIWTVIDDLIRHKGKAYRRMFFLNSIFAITFGALLWWLHASVFIDKFWMLFVVAWLSMYTFDFLRHKEDPLWSGTARHLFFGITSAVLGISSILLDWPCQWWPFMIMSVGSLLLWLAHKN